MKCIEKRNCKDRRKKQERRSRNFKLRLRIGFGNIYKIAVNLDTINSNLGVSEILQLPNLLQEEASKFKFFNSDGQLCEVRSLLDESIYNVYKILRKKKEIKPLYVIDALADELCNKYRVEMNDRRKLLRRRDDIPIYSDYFTMN